MTTQENMIAIEVYKDEYQAQVIELILDIQQNEFKVPITINDQPDLLDVKNFYCKNNGNFWVAKNGDEIIGTVALIDTGNHQSALRKMFLKTAWRGKEFGIGQQLLDVLISWCKEKTINEIYLGTRDQLEAAMRFYLRNGFTEVAVDTLPESFPRMAVDNRFFKLVI